MIYLDHNATTAPLPEVIAAMSAAMREHWANPSSRHAPGEAAKRALAAARAEVAALFNALPVELVFTSGATEANHHVLHAALARPGAPRRLILSAIEHAAFIKAARVLEAGGVELTLLPVDAHGVVRLDALQEALARPAALVSVMLANNETGVCQPVAEVAALARAHGVPCHTDATQAAGKLPIDFASLGVDLLSCSAHKLHGPKGVGALLIRKGLVWPALFAGQQERARRGGTENLPGIAGFAAAARAAALALPAEATRLALLREACEARLAALPGCTIHGAAATRLPNTISLRLAGFSADKLLAVLERAGICASSGAACSSGGSEPSHVLCAMGVPPEAALGAIRLSCGTDTTAEGLARVVDLLQALAATAPESNPIKEHAA